MEAAAERGLIMLAATCELLGHEHLATEQEMNHYRCEFNADEMLYRWMQAAASSLGLIYVIKQFEDYFFM